MPASPEKENPIARRYHQLVQHWLAFTGNPEARICRWLIAEDELRMIDGFYKVQVTEHNQTGDLFFKFSIPFTDAASYGPALYEELLRQIRALQEATDEEDIKRWQPILSHTHSSDMLPFLSNLGAFAHTLNLPQGYLVAYMAPKDMDDVEQWASWWLQATHTGIPQKVRLMVIDARDIPVLESVAKRYPRQVVSITPNLQMAAALNELAATGDPADPGVQFRKAFVHLTQAIGRQDQAMVAQMAAKALKIAEQNQWPQMKVTVHMAQGAACLGAQQFEKAFQVYGQARKVAEQAYTAGDPASGKLTVTALFSQGAAMLAAKEYSIAAKVYGDAVPFAKKTEDYYNLMEAWRMAGFCYQQLDDVPNAWHSYWQALETAPQLDEKMRPNSTLPYIGQALLTLAPQVEREEMTDLIRERMIFLVGDDWREKATAV